MDKEKYEQALERAKEYYEAYEGKEMMAHARGALEYIFPELAESEDERIRKEMIFYFTEEIPQCSIQEHSDKMREFISWLKRQEVERIKLELKAGNSYFCYKSRWERADSETFKKGLIYKCNKDGVLDNFVIKNPEQHFIEIKDERIAWLEKQGEQKDVIIPNIYEDIENWMNSICYPVGDNVPPIPIIQSAIRKTALKFFELGLQGKQKAVNECPNTSSDKEVKVSDEYKKGFECGKQRVLKYPQDFNLQPKQEWSEEDEKIRKALFKYFTISDNDAYYEVCGVATKKILVWLDKQREQKSTWGEEDEELLNDIIVDIEVLRGQDGTKEGKAAYQKEITWLKSLRPQNRWKPSEEMLDALYRAIPENTMAISEDEMLLDKLYQGLKYGRVLSNK